MRQKKKTHLTEWSGFRARLKAMTDDERDARIEALEAEVEGHQAR